MEIPLLLELVSVGMQKLPDAIDRETTVFMGRYLEGINRAPLGLVGQAIARNPEAFIIIPVEGGMGPRARR
jgi:hypothetical protein